MNIIIAILIFSFIIFFHEMGHFLLAKKNDVRVNEFSIGMGPRIFHFTRGETTYCLKALPFGGSCAMEGEDEESNDDRAFNKKTLWQKFQIVFAGPFFNLLLGFLLSLILIGVNGYSPAVIEDVMDGYPAQEAGLKAGDEITKLGGYNVHFYNEVSIYTFFHNDEPFEVTVKRNDETIKTTVTPKYSEEDKRYLVGITGGVAHVRPGIIGTITHSFYYVKYQVYMVVESLKGLFRGKFGLNDLSGPVGIVKSMGDTYNEAAKVSVISVIFTMLNYMILLTSNLGVMNLLPIPALDGGRILIYIVEGITRRKMPEKVEGYINIIGFFILMALMVVVMGNDIRKLFMR
ncbi:MAG: RIP metalloprotease RseP [Lachnospiraceae bacterium]|nr:RIP metalloprotease RseP [Lachnospiraceae bacterium]